MRDLQPLRWSRRRRYDDSTIFTTFFHDRAVLSGVSSWGLGLLLSITEPRGFLTPDEEQVARRFAAEFGLRDLFSGPIPWLVGDPLRVDWDRYYGFMTDWGAALWKIVSHHGFSG